MSDLISRQDAIDAMAELQGKASTKAELKAISKAWKRIKQLPSAQDELESAYQEGYTYAESKYRDFLPKRGEWIPCSERLPEKQVGSYLITIDDGWVGEAEYHGTFWIQYRWSANILLNKVLAWTPLPEPYKEETTK